MTTDELRAKFLQFFEERGHKVCPSDPLVPPPDDKSLLFTGAGMNAFKNEFLQRVPLKFTRAASSQKCLRTADIEEVGRTDVHHTFFEMLGNFSFNDYFKRESIAWAWEFLTRDLSLPAEKMVVTVHKDDEEAFDAWAAIVPRDRIRRLGDKENFWPADAPKKGPNGLCGPCSEIFYDRGEDLSCGHPWCGIECDCDRKRFFEVWNLVFQQFDRRDGGVLEPLPYKNIDTGMGLERIAAVVQGVRSNFDIDIFRTIIADGAELLDVDPHADAETVRRTRRIADHIRAVAFCIGDGILPSNQGRGYVLRKLIRTAVRDGVALGHEEPFLFSLVPTVARVMRAPYPEITEHRDHIARVVRAEEEHFHETLRNGMQMLDEMVREMRRTGEKVLRGEKAFRLFDTHGFPLEVAEAVLAEQGLGVDREGFEREMHRQRAAARARTQISADIFGSGPLVELKERGLATEFVGYRDERAAAEVRAILSGEDLVEMADEGETVGIVLDRSPFYGEAGGQVGDTGLLKADDAVVDVADCRWGEGMILHLGTVRCGRIKVGDRVACEPDLDRRTDIRRNHTATHLLHHALREVLGPHVAQAGSLVAPDRLRFDFTHPEALTDEQIRRVEDLVNARILANDPVAAHETTLEKAKAAGALALFGEKYGEEVRMVAVGDYSKELCGGLHVSATGDIGLFKILSEGSVAAGVRRIEAATGRGALAAVRATEDILARLSALLKTPRAKIEERVAALLEQVKTLRAEVRRAGRRAGGASADDLLARAKEVAGVKVVAYEVPEGDARRLREIADALTKQKEGVAAFLAARAGKGAQLVVALSRVLVERGLDAVQIARAAGAEIGGGGGGRPAQAQAGGKNADGISAALRKAEDLLAERLGGSAQRPRSHGGS